MQGNKVVLLCLLLAPLLACLLRSTPDSFLWRGTVEQQALACSFAFGIEWWCGVWSGFDSMPTQRQTTAIHGVGRIHSCRQSQSNRKPYSPSVSFESSITQSPQIAVFASKRHGRPLVLSFRAAACMCEQDQSIDTQINQQRESQLVRKKSALWPSRLQLVCPSEPYCCIIVREILQ